MDRLVDAVRNSVLGGVATWWYYDYSIMSATVAFYGLLYAQSRYDPILYNTLKEIISISYYRATGTTPPAPKKRPAMKKMKIKK